MRNAAPLYKECMRFHDYGRALYHPVKTTALRPGSCGYFDEDERWKAVVDFNDAKALEKYNLAKPKEEFKRGEPDTTAEWGELCSVGVEKADVGIDGVSIPSLPMTAKVQVKYKSSKNFGAVLITTSPIHNECIENEHVFGTWFKDNVKALRASDRKSEIEKNGLYIITRTYSTSKCSLVTWLGSSKEFSAGFSARYAGVASAEVNAKREWYVDSGHWKTHTGSDDERIVIFVCGYIYKFPTLFSQLFYEPRYALRLSREIDIRIEIFQGKPFINESGNLIRIDVSKTYSNESGDETLIEEVSKRYFIDESGNETLIEEENDIAGREPNNRSGGSEGGGNDYGLPEGMERAEEGVDVEEDADVEEDMDTEEDMDGEEDVDVEEGVDEEEDVDVKYEGPRIHNNFPKEDEDGTEGFEDDGKGSHMDSKENDQLVLYWDSDGRPVLDVNSDGSPIYVQLSPPPRHEGAGKRAIVQYDYGKAEDNEIELKEGEYVTNIDMVDEDWWMGQNAHGETGLFPSNYVELVEDGAGAAAPVLAAEEHAPSPGPPPAKAGPTATAQYDYEAAEDNEISFPEGAKISNLEFPDADWWMGEYGGKSGLFPANYVQLDG